MKLVVLTNTLVPTPWGEPFEKPEVLSAETLSKIKEKFQDVVFWVSRPYFLANNLESSSCAGDFYEADWYYSARFLSSVVVHKNAIFSIDMADSNLAAKIIAARRLVAGELDLYIPNPSIDALSNFDEQLSRVVADIKNNPSRDVKILQLQSFHTPRKFAEWGETAVFVSPDLQVYYHPEQYYKGEAGIGNLFEISFENGDLLGLTKPHLACKTCNTFYCDRNIVLNKRDTTEYKVPSDLQCQVTDIYTKYQKELYEGQINKESILFDSRFWDPETAYHQLLEDYIDTNRIKQCSYLQEENTIRNRKFQSMLRDTLEWIKEALE